MRVRFKAWAVTYIENNFKNQLFINDNFKDEILNFINEKPTFLEIGPGKGDFIIELAKKYPQNNYIVIELNKVISGMCLKKIDESELENIKLICGNFINFVDFLPHHLIDGLFLNFSDPWPKKRHEKRRLTHKMFLEKYKEILKEDALIIFKTDNDDLFNFSLDEFKNNNYRIIYLNEDYNELEDFDALTEFEKRFKGKGIKIKRVKVRQNG